jgi:uncharacterized protein YecA (UPF0149 family)
MKEKPKTCCREILKKYNIDKRLQKRFGKIVQASISTRTLTNLFVRLFQENSQLLLPKGFLENKDDLCV